MKDFAKQKISEGFDYVIMGHSHNAEEIDYEEGKYINLGEFFRDPTFGYFDGKEMHLESVKKFLEG